MIFEEICDRKPLCLLVFIVFLQILLPVRSSYGQDIQSQSDSIWLEDNYFIQKEFHFRRSGNDTIFHGRHSLFLKPYLSDTMIARSYNYERLEVNFNNNIKQGPFVQSAVNFYPDISRFDPVGAYVNIPYRGSRTEVRGQFDGNRPSGQWFFSQFEQKTGEATDTVMLGYAFYSPEGMPDQQFRISDKHAGQVISGSFNNEGHFNGILDVRNSEKGSVVASYNFDDGLLTAIRIPEEGIIRPAYLENNGEYDFQEHALDSLYTKVLSYYLQRLPEEEMTRVLAPLRTVFHSFKFLSGGNSILTNYLPGGYDITPPTVRLPVYEPDDQERQFIQETYNRLSNLHKQTDSLMHVSAFSLNRYVDRELSSLYARSALLRNRVSRQRNIFEVLSGPLQEHINPEWFLNRRLGEISQRDTVSYTFNEQQFQEEMDFNFQQEGLSPFEQYQAYLSSLEDAYEEISEQSLEQMQQLQLDTRLEEREDRITDLSEEIDELADSLVLNLYDREISEAYKQSFVTFKERLLERYANMGARERMASTENIISCLESLKAQLENAPRLAQKAILVDEAYMDRHLNPYTYTETDVRLYERLFSAYRDKLVPYVVERMTPAQDCDDFLQKADNLERLQDFMLSALERNPGRLDRRARSQENPETIIRRLGVPVVF